MATPQLVLFDLGGVVCNFVPERRLSAFASESKLSPEEIHDTLWISGFSAACDAGQYSGTEMYAEICQRLNLTLPRCEVNRLWALAFEPHSKVLAIVEGVRHYVRTGLLTNNPPLLRDALPTFLAEIEKRFDPIIFSYAYRATKPSRTLYEAVVQQTSIAANEILFIDDSITNVRGASSVGWQTIHFRNPDQLREALRELSII